MLLRRTGSQAGSKSVGFRNSQVKLRNDLRMKGPAPAVRLRGTAERRATFSA